MKLKSLLLFGLLVCLLVACNATQEKITPMQAHERPVNVVMQQNAAQYATSSELLIEMQALVAASAMEIVQVGDLHFMTFGGEQGDKKLLFVETGAHAREIATVEVGRLFVHALSSDPEFMQWLDRVYVVVLLNANPSGRDQVLVNNNYMWRKSALPEELLWSDCPSSPNSMYTDQHPGVDLNRQWGEYSGVNELDRCNNDYPGQIALSHPYVLAEKQFTDQHFQNGGTALVIHSPASYVVYLGEESDTSPDQQLASMIGAMTGYSYGYFTPGDGANSLTSFSYFDSIAQASVFIELPEVDETGFFPSPEQVRTELWEKSMRAVMLKALEFTASLP